jgi:hypothetical protein
MHQASALLLRLTNVSCTLPHPRLQPLFRDGGLPPHLRTLLQATPNSGRWLLKSPIHTQSIDSLLHVFPDAKIIQLERDSEEVLGSICSLSAGFRCMVSDHIDGKEIGREVRKFLIRDTGKSQKILAEHPKIVLKIHYRQFIDHPIETIQKIFEFTGVKYSDEAESRIKSEMKVSVPNKFGRHIYRLEDYF